MKQIDPNLQHDLMVTDKTLNGILNWLDNPINRKRASTITGLILVATDSQQIDTRLAVTEDTISERLRKNAERIPGAPCNQYPRLPSLCVIPGRYQWRRPRFRDRSNYCIYFLWNQRM